MRRVFQESFREGEAIRVTETLKQGSGIYRIRLVFEDATGFFEIDVPTANEL